MGSYVHAMASTQTNDLALCGTAQRMHAFVVFFSLFISMLDLVKFCIRNVSNNLSSIQKLLIIHNHVFPIFNSFLLLSLLLPLLLSSSSHFRSFFQHCVCMCCCFFVLFCIDLLANSILAHETFYFVCWALPSPLDFINAYTLIYLIAIFFPQLLSHSLIISISLFHRRKCQLKISQPVEL